MKKEEKSTPVSSKTKSLYKYELQATNQILKETLDLYPSSLHSTAQTNRNQKAQLQQFDEYLFEENSSNQHLNPQSKQKSLLREHSEQILNRQIRLCSSNNIFEVNQQIKKYNFKEAFSKDKFERLKKNIEKDVENQNSSQIYSYSSENQVNHLKKIQEEFERSKQPVAKKSKNFDAKVELKRQRRGLASISLKVKNIVAKMGKMTFKDVSDEVLKETEEDLPNDPEQREKQTKNIRRRVYDALNVLVSVKILGKQQKFVVHTDLTNIPGKKLSFHWQQINEKNRILEEKQATYKQKFIHLTSLKRKYEEILLLHERNKNCVDIFCKNDIYAQSLHKDRINISPSHDRYYFPLIFLIPPRLLEEKIKVHIEVEQNQSQRIKKFIVEGNEYVLTELQILKFLNLQAQVPYQQKDTVRNHIDVLENMMDDSISLSRGRLFDYDQDIYLDD